MTLPLEGFCFALIPGAWKNTGIQDPFANRRWADVRGNAAHRIAGEIQLCTVSDVILIIGSHDGLGDGSS